MKYVNLECHPADSRIRIVEEDICQTLNQRMGTGGGNVPLIMVLDNDSNATAFFKRDSHGNGNKPNA